ncbi:Chitin binding domain, partial [Trinorchestia longiramus]
CVPPCPSPDAIYQNPRDCTSYFQCVFGEPILMDCNSGLYYNPASETCDFPDQVICKNGPLAPCVAVTYAP